MNHQPKRSRLGKLIGGVLVGSALSIGAAAGAVSADEPGDDVAEVVVSEQDSSSPSQFKFPISFALRSGIRW